MCTQRCALQQLSNRTQHTKVAGCDNKHTAHSAAHEQRQQFDDNLATTYQLDAYLPHCSICCQPQGAKQHAQKRCAHQHQVINPTCPITSVPTRGSQQELQHVLPVPRLPCCTLCGAMRPCSSLAEIVPQSSHLPAAVPFIIAQLALQQQPRCTTCTCAVLRIVASL